MYALLYVCAFELLARWAHGSVTNKQASIGMNLTEHQGEKAHCTFTSPFVYLSISLCVLAQAFEMNSSDDPNPCNLRVTPIKRPKSSNLVSTVHACKLIVTELMHEVHCLGVPLYSNRTGSQPTTPRQFDNMVYHNDLADLKNVGLTLPVQHDLTRP